MVLLEYGLPKQLVDLIMTPVTTISYSLIINRGLTTCFQEKKGLRLGYPLSPYLFVLVMEYLNRSLKQLWRLPSFNFYPKREKLGLVNICFADDLLMCCRDDKESIELMP